MEGRVSRRRAGLSAAVITLIILAIGVALTMVAMAIAGGYITMWGAVARVTIERADVLVDPSTGTAYITVDIRNTGGAKLTGCEVTVDGRNVGTATDLNPGQSASFSGTDNLLVAGNTYVVQVTCDDPAGKPVSDQKSVLAHI